MYESFNGPSGNGIDDLFTPEIDSNAVEPNGQPYPGGIAWTGDDAATKQYDSYKVQAIINEIDGYDHSGRYTVGVPAIFGMNFQAVSVAEKLLKSPAVLIGPDANGNYTLGPELLGGYSRARPPRVRCCRARLTTSTRSCSGWSTRSSSRA